MTVAYGTDIDKAIAVVDDVGREMAGDPVWKRRVLEAPRVERVQALAENGVTLKILGTVRAADQWAAAGDFRKRLLAAFKEHGIEMPAPAARRPDPQRQDTEPGPRPRRQTTSPRARSSGDRRRPTSSPRTGTRAVR